MNNPFSSGGAVRQLLERVPRISRKTIYIIGAGAGGLAMATYLLYQYSLPTPPPPEPNVNPSKNETWFKTVQVRPPAPRAVDLPPPPEVAPPPEVKPNNGPTEPATEDPIKARLEEMRIEARFEQPLLNLAFPNTAQNNEPGNNTEADKAEKKIELTEIKRPRTPFEIKTGTVIPAVLMTGINSDLPGMIIATVRENVYDSVTGSHLLIPQGAKLIGQYESDIRMGQNRVMIGFNKMQLPDGGTIDLQGIPASDPAGYAGFADQVDNHFWKIFGQSLLWAIINAGAQMGQNQGDYTFSNEDYGSQAQDELSASMQETADAIVRRNLNIAPTLKIRPGYRFNVMVVNDLVFPGTYDGKF
jgi:type IV secretory pathway VirB10-like protein